MNIAIVCAAINLITNYFGIMWFGYAAVAYTTLACYILMAILHYCSMERMLRKITSRVKFMMQNNSCYIIGLCPHWNSYGRS